MDTALACAPFGFRQQHLHEYDYSESYETFHIDDLLDFDNDDIGAPIGNCEEDNENTTSVDSTEASVSVSASASVSLDRNNSPENPLADEALCSELYVPTDALADLEWLSPYMVDDDFSSLPAVVPSYDGKISKDGDETKASQQKNLQGCEERTKDFSTCSMGQWRFPVRARRSKRSRTGGRVWTTYPLLILPNCSAFEALFTFTSSDSSSSATSATSRPPLKKMKVNHSKKSQEAAAPPRRCSHCLVQKTPQWRAGPDGPKTLCNACGVRYKSGRLLPEYRPAVSPTFVSDVHSNSHRKVLELRRQKDEHHKFEPQICEKMASEEDEEDRREYSTVTEETFIEY